MLTFDQLDQDGYMTIANLVTQDELDQFEAAIATLVRAQTTRAGITPKHDDPFEDLFGVGGAYTARLYALMERLGILQQITTRISDELKTQGFYDWAEIEVPLVWPDVRADPRSDQTGTLPVHQDFASMQSEKSWRLWIPLRPSNAQRGSMRAYPGTHKAGVVEHNVSDPLKPCLDATHYSDVESVVFDLPAGDAVLINPLLFHASVPNASNVTKFTLMVQIQDLAAMIDPTDTQSPFHPFTELTALRAQARRNRDAQANSRQ